MQAIVLAGGLGTRLRGIVSNVPKPMAPIQGRPFLDILLTKLSLNGFRRVVLAVGYLSEVIVNYFGARFAGMDIDYVVEDSPLGTGGAVRFATTKITADHVYVLNGDTFLNLEFTAVEALWNAHKEQIMVARHVANTARYGRLVVFGQKITGFLEKGVEGAGLINGGAYVLRSDALNDFPIGKNFSLETEYFQVMVENTPLRPFITQGHFIDIGVPDDFLRAQTELMTYI